MGDISIILNGHGPTDAKDNEPMLTNGISDGDKIQVRNKMTAYWHEHSKEASVQEMMLDTDADVLTKLECPEVLSYLPPWDDKEIVELGAGIGRFTGKLADKATHVTAVDFMETFINKNKEVHGKLDNVDFRVADVTQLDLKHNCCDMLFSNWLMMYLDDSEVQRLIHKVLSWIREGGYFFARESCVKQSGNKVRTENPTKYRDPAMYMAMFSMLTIPTDNPEEVLGFELVMSRPLKTYMKIKHNQHQVVWLLKKLRRKADSDHGYKTFKEFLDNQQYSLNGILAYEKIFGRTFISTGGLNTTKDFVARLDLQQDETVLDVGCGIGGSAFYMVKEFGVKVMAIDLSSNMIHLGLERAQEVGIDEEEVQFEIADATKRDYKAESFDVVYSRDTILHIADKLALFRSFYNWLKPGGRLLISDYCCSDGDHSDTFTAYVQQRGYTLLSPAAYGKVLEEAGFSNVKADDRTDLFVASLEQEVQRLESNHDTFVQEFSQKEYDYLITGWQDKLQRTQDQRWGVFYAEKH